MGNNASKINFRKAVVQLSKKNHHIDAKEDDFWDQFWCEPIDDIGDIFTLVPSSEIRSLREESPSNLATLIYKAVEKLVNSSDTLCNTSNQQLAALNSARILTRVIPYVFEDSDWRGLFWSSLPSQSSDSSSPLNLYDTESTNSGHGLEKDEKNIPLAHSLILAVCDLLFCPDFTVNSLPQSKTKSNTFGSPDSPPEDLQSIDSCEYIWESGVGFISSTTSTAAFNKNRTELLRLLLTSFSTTIYLSSSEAHHTQNRWIAFFTSSSNRHALPIFTSLLNTTFAYEPTGIHNHFFTLFI